MATGRRFDEFVDLLELSGNELLLVHKDGIPFNITVSQIRQALVAHTPQVLDNVLPTIIAGANPGWALPTNAFNWLDTDGTVRAVDNVTDKWDLRAVTTAAGQFKKVALVIDNVQFLILEGASAGTQAAALLPQIPWNYLPVAIVEIPANYTGDDITGFVIHDMRRG